MAVNVDVEGLVRNALNADSSPFVLVGASHPASTDALAGLDHAMQRTNTGFEELDLGSGPPHLTPRGPASQLNGVDVVSEREIADWFRLLADTLTGLGWSGRIEPIRWQDRPIEHTGAQPWLATTLALSGWTHVRRQVVIPPWTTTPSLVPALVDLAVTWVSAVEGELWFAAMNWVRGRPETVQAALSARLSTGSRGFCEIWCQTAERARRVRFSSYGHVTLEERSPEDLTSRLAALQTACLPWASRVDRACTTGDVGPSHPSWFIELARRDTSDKLPSWYYPHGRHLDARKVPDSCAEQILTGEHLAVANRLRGWRVEEVATDRFLVTHPEPSGWFRPFPSGLGGTRVDPDLLARARAEFGSMILTAADR